MGAVAGGVIAAVTGGDILKGVLKGGLIGGVVGLGVGAIKAMAGTVASTGQLAASYEGATEGAGLGVALDSEVTTAGGLIAPSMSAGVATEGAAGLGASISGGVNASTLMEALQAQATTTAKWSMLTEGGKAAVGAIGAADQAKTAKEMQEQNVANMRVTPVSAADIGVNLPSMDFTRSYRDYLKGPTGGATPANTASTATPAPLSPLVQSQNMNNTAPVVGSALNPGAQLLTPGAGVALAYGNTGAQQNAGAFGATTPGLIAQQRTS